MAALTGPRDTEVLTGTYGRFGAVSGLIVKDAEVLYAGALLQMDENGEVVAGGPGALRRYLGRCPKTLDNADDGLVTEVDRGQFHWNLSGADANDVMKSAYVVDDQTVSFSRHGAGTAQVNTVTPTAVNSTLYTASLRWDEHGDGKWQSSTLIYESDGSATATEICDALRARIAAVNALTGVITGSGTVTLVLTGAHGVRFEFEDQGPGVLADAATTPGVYIDYALAGTVVGYNSTGVFVDERI